MTRMTARPAAVKSRRAERRPGSGGALERGLRVLVAVAESGDARADEIAQETDLPVSTVYRYLRILRDMDLIEERNKFYLPGGRLLELSGQHLTHTKLVELGHSFLHEISEATGETAVLTVRVGTQAMCLRQVESSQPLRMAFKINQLLPLYAGAGQRMLLAHAPDAVVERVLAKPLRHITDGTLDSEQIRRDIREVRRNGVLVSHAEFSVGAVAVAVPVFANGEIVCSLTAAGPEQRCPASWVKRAHNALRSASKHLAEVLEQHPGS